MIVPRVALPVLAAVLLSLSAAGCGKGGGASGSSSGASTPMKATTSLSIAPTAASAAPTAVPGALTKAAPASVSNEAPAVNLSTVDMARAYMAALYKNDAVTMVRLFPLAQVDFNRGESQLEIVRLTAQAMTNQEAGDNDPVSTSEYAKVVIDVKTKGKSGIYTYTYKIATNVQNGVRVISTVALIRDWK